MTSDIDLHVGKRLRRRRRLMGYTQQQLAESVGVRFQQIQKYECAANRITASRLFDLSQALGVSVQFFFDGFNANKDCEQNEAAFDGAKPANDTDDGPSRIPADVLSKKETMELIRAYYRLGNKPRRHLLEFAKSLEEADVDFQAIERSIPVRLSRS